MTPGSVMSEPRITPMKRTEFLVGQGAQGLHDRRVSDEEEGVTGRLLLTETFQHDRLEVEEDVPLRAGVLVVRSGWSSRQASSPMC